jgi:hypothetical protein
MDVCLLLLHRLIFANISFSSLQIAGTRSPGKLQYMNCNKILVFLITVHCVTSICLDKNTNSTAQFTLFALVVRHKIQCVRNVAVQLGYGT